MSRMGYRALDESGVSHLGEPLSRRSGTGWEPGSDLFGLLPAPIPYGEFKKRMAEVSTTAREASRSRRLCTHQPARTEKNSEQGPFFSRNTQFGG